jgi:hypothetical protein
MNLCMLLNIFIQKKYLVDFSNFCSAKSLISYEDNFSPVLSLAYSDYFSILKIEEVVSTEM